MGYGPFAQITQVYPALVHMKSACLWIRSSVTRRCETRPAEWMQANGKMPALDASGFRWVQSLYGTSANIKGPRRGRFSIAFDVQQALLGCIPPKSSKNVLRDVRHEVGPCLPIRSARPGQLLREFVESSGPLVTQLHPRGQFNPHRARCSECHRQRIGALDGHGHEQWRLGPVGHHQPTRVRRMHLSSWQSHSHMSQGCRGWMR